MASGRKFSDHSIDMNNLRKTVLYSSIIAITSAGLIYQIVSIFSRYFRFKTATIITVLNPLTIKIPSLRKCWDIDGILNVTAINKDLDMNFPEWEKSPMVERGFVALGHRCFSNFQDR